ncbi:hypothetical protein BCR34DRAFT_616084 [Clohesyomyces aquaticus]|uniref:RING-type domain-containing protein n=1 Tax=Clohesyomyces aquaticus TaxID=1231657 RepID=A0A1Y1ZFF7_9PLEO|nr:hypothetical protein BCR34DRAFT_616084 [Clohesyomyces aquaticus]
MDSQLGQRAKTGTVEEWAVQTAADARWTTGYNCYYSGQCPWFSTTTPLSSIAPSASPATSSSPNIDRKLNTTIALATSIPIILTFIIIAVIWLALRRHRCLQKEKDSRRDLQEQQRRDDEKRQADLINQEFLQVLLDILENNRSQRASPGATAEARRQSRRASRSGVGGARAFNERMTGIETNLSSLQALVRRLPGASSRTPEPVNVDPFENELAEALTCPICMEILTNPVSVITSNTHRNQGCLHTFCARCAQQFMAVDSRCPIDRYRITGVNDHRMLAEIVTMFLHRYPTWTPSNGTRAEAGVYPSPPRKQFEGLPM